MEIQKALDELRNYREKHFNLGELVIKADNGAFFPLDILVVATLNRSLCLKKGFISLIESQNLIAAVPLIRLQIDNCLRLSAATLVNDPHKFALNVLDGIPIKNQKDISNQKMTDTYLVKNLSKRYAWIQDVYSGTSGYVHLSEKHIFNSIKARSEEFTLDIKITDKDEFVTDDVYIEAINDFRRSTDVLFEFVYAWAYTKEYPEKAKEQFQKQVELQKQKRG